MARENERATKVARRGSKNGTAAVEERPEGEAPEAPEAGENEGSDAGAQALHSIAEQTWSPAWQSRIVGEGDEAPDQLLANPNNVRIHPDGQQKAMSEVLRRIGWLQRVIVNRRTGFVVDGHLRVMLALSEGQTSVPVQYVDITDEEEQEVLLTFDPIAALAGYDQSLLSTNALEVQKRLDPDSTLSTFLEALVRANPVPRDPFEGNEGADPTEPGDESVQSERIGGADDEGDEDDQNGSVAHIVELRFTSEAAEEFLTKSSALIAHLGLEALEDVVIQLVRDSYDTIQPEPVGT